MAYPLAASLPADTQTTISGNTTAAEAIQAMSDATNSVLQAVGQASTNLQSIAADFEATGSGDESYLYQSASYL
jgi:type VII secretion effector (TIGR04197 family)